MAINGRRIITLKTSATVAMPERIGTFRGCTEIKTVIRLWFAKSISTHNARITGASKVKTNYGNKFMNNEQNESDAKARPVDTLVMLTCPFCGGTDTGVIGWNGGRRAVKCSHCDITGPVGYKGWTDDRSGGKKDAENKNEAIRLWNSRAT